MSTKRADILNGAEALFAKHPAAKGYLRPREGYRLMERREDLTRDLQRELEKMRAPLQAGSAYELAPFA